MIDAQLEELIEYRRGNGSALPSMTRLSNGGALVKVPGVRVEGWNRSELDVLFLAPPGYPAARPDCFWVEPAGLRLANGATPQSSNDSNPIPGDDILQRSTTWFSWHVQSWDPSRDSLRKYFGVILNRLKPAR
jgi:E2/UBC family protein E